MFCHTIDIVLGEVEAPPPPPWCDRPARYRYMQTAHSFFTSLPVTIASIASSTCGSAAILASKALAQNDVELGSISLCISLGYFVFDLFIIVQQQEEPFWALVAHHILSGGALGVAAISIPEAVWFANLGQCSESCLPLMFLVWLLEQRGHHIITPSMFSAVRD